MRPLCIGWTTIRRLARDGQAVFDDGTALIAASDLFHCDVFDLVRDLLAALDRDQVDSGSVAQIALREMLRAMDDRPIR